MSPLQLPLTHSPPTCIGDDAARLGHKLLAHKVKYRDSQTLETEKSEKSNESQKFPKKITEHA